MAIKPWFMPYSVWLNSTPVIPKLYWGVYSQEERILHICKEIGNMVAYLDEVGIKVNATHEEVEALAKELADFYDNFADDFQVYYEERIAEWLDEHMREVIEASMRFLWFGLSDEGYFVAYIPSNWDNLHFDTGMVYSDPDTYGHLILTY